MKFSCVTENLLKGLQTTFRAIPTKSILPILKNVLIETTEDGLLLAATNQNTTIKTTVRASVDKEGKITVPAKLLRDFVSNLSSHSFEAEVKKDILHITAEKTKSKINGINAQDYPELPDINITDNYIELDPRTLESALNYVLFAVGGPDSQPIFTGVYVLAEDGLLTLVGCDGFRLAEKTISIENKDISFEVLIPAREFAEIIKVFTSDDEPLKMSADSEQNSVAFQNSITSAATTLLGGQYPDYKRIVPDEEITTATFNTDELLEAITLTNIFNKSEEKIIKLKIDEKGIKVMSLSTEDGEHTGEIDATVEGIPMEIAFKSRFITDYLNNHKGNSVNMYIKEATSSVKLISPDHKDYLHVVMPMQTH